MRCATLQQHPVTVDLIEKQREVFLRWDMGASPCDFQRNLGQSPINLVLMWVFNTYNTSYCLLKNIVSAMLSFSVFESYLFFLVIRLEL